MKLQIKLMLVNISLVLILLVSVSIISYIIINKNFLELEDENVNVNIQRVSEGFVHSMEVLETVVLDWAPWDDTYEFVNGEYPEYIDSNLEDETLINIGTDFILFTNSSGDVYYLITLEELEESKKNILNYQINNNPELFNTGEITGVIGTTGTPLVISSQPILKSDRSGPAAGYLTMGYFLGDTMTEELENLVKLPTEALKYNEIKDSEMLAKLNNEEIYVSKSKASLEAYTPISNIEGDPEIVLKITIERKIFNKGISSLRLFLLLLLVVGILTIISLVILSKVLSKRITGPISELSLMASKIGEGNLNQKINLNAENEIKTLALSLEKMQQDLRASQQQLSGANKELNTKVKQRTKALESKIKELEKINKLTMDRELKMLELKKEIKELKGGKNGQVN